MSAARLGAALRHPTLWLIAQALLVFALAHQPPGLVPAYYSSDSYEFLEALHGDPWTQSLSSRRTLGYPLMLEGIQALPGGIASLPSAQLAVYLLAVVVLGAAAGLYLGSSLSGLVMATPLLWSRLAGDHAASVLAEVPAASFAALTLASLLWSAARPKNRWALGAIGGTLFVTYQMRPAYLFLLPLVPVLATWLSWSRSDDSSRWLPSRQWLAASKRRLVALAALCLLPFLAWCGFRAVFVGHFGLVSFGGTNIIGVAISFLTPDVVAKLPAEHQALGQAILERRTQQGIRTGAGRVYEYRRFVRNYNRNIWHIAVPIARQGKPARFDTEGRFWVETNTRFSRFAWAVIGQRPTFYARWVADALLETVRQLAREPAMRWSALLALAAAVWARLSPAARPPLLDRAGIGLLAAVVVWALAGVLLACLVEPPVDRYWLAASLFLPGTLSVVAFEMVRPRVVA